MTLSWIQLMTMLPNTDEETLHRMINEEIAGAGRKNFIVRMHQRYCQLRTARERLQLIKGVSLPNMEKVK